MSALEKTIPVHERFYAFQGEGRHMGRSAFFIRTFGCPVHCPWCDSAGTWHKNYVPSHVDRMTVDAITQEAVSHNPSFAVITGGEPTVQPNFGLLAKHLAAHRIPVHLETCGAFKFDSNNVKWTTVSPKREKLPLEQYVVVCDELKIIVDHPHAVDEWFATLDNICGGRHWIGGKTVWLHPEWSQRDNPLVLNAISTAVKNSRPADDIRAGYQLHKLYKVDSLDENSKPTVPLGGDPSKGY